MTPESQPVSAFTLYLEAWPQADLQLKVQRPLALARQSIVLHLARTAGSAGGVPLFLARTPVARCRLQALAGSLDAPILDATSGWAEGTAPGSHAVYVRWGSGGLLGPASLRTLANAASDGRAWGNRTPVADILARLAPITSAFDRPPDALFPPAAATLFRLLTGGDLALLAAHAPALLPEEAAALPAPEIAQNVLAAARFMAQRAPELLVIGDPGAAGWKHLERETACRVRLLADAPGGLLARLLEASGAARFTQYLRELGDGALVNTRILFDPSDTPDANDFFWSDLGHPDRVRHRRLRALTDALLASDQAVVLGGASLMAGGIYLLMEKAWADRELPRQVDVVEAQSSSFTKE